MHRKGFDAPAEDEDNERTRWSLVSPYDKDFFRRRSGLLLWPKKINGEWRFLVWTTWVEQFTRRVGKDVRAWVPIYWDHEEGELV